MEKEMATHSSTEEPGGLQFMGLHDWERMRGWKEMV